MNAFVSMAIVLVMSSLLSPANCRNLRPAAAAVRDGSWVKGGAENVISMEAALGSLSHDRLSIRGLMIVLASGPSKRGPVH